MTPGHARFALTSFFFVLTGVTINALYMQAGTLPRSKTTAERVAPRPTVERPRKAPDATRGQRISQASPDEPTFHIARFAPDSAPLDTLPEVPEETTDVETVRAIQRELKQRGYGPVAGDGTMSLATRAAIMAFEHDQGLALTAEANDLLLKRLLLGASSAGDAAGARKVASAQAEQVVRTVQQALATLGYQPGRTDGRLGESTVSAIRDFEVDKGLVPKGRVSAELVVRLGDTATATRPRAR
jgi:Putative peptidoglycan binding domain